MAEKPCAVREIPSFCLFQMLTQEIHCQWPGSSSSSFVAHAVIGIEEGVTGLVDLHCEIFARFSVQALDFLPLGCRNTIILAAIDSQNRCIDLRHLLWCGIITAAVERHSRTQIAVARSYRIGQETADTKAYQAQFLWINI